MNNNTDVRLMAAEVHPQFKLHWLGEVQKERLVKKLKSRIVE